MVSLPVALARLVLGDVLGDLQQQILSDRPVILGRERAGFAHQVIGLADVQDPIRFGQGLLEHVAAGKAGLIGYLSHVRAVIGYLA